MTDSDKPTSGKQDVQKDEDTLKEDMTSHWDLDVLSRKELDEVMAKRRSAEPPSADDESGGETNTLDDQPDSTDESPLKAGLLLLAFALVLLVVGVLLLRL